MQEQDEVIAGYIIQLEDEQGEYSFWTLHSEWDAELDEARLYENEEDATEQAESLQQKESGVVTVEPVFEGDEEDWDDADEA